MKTTVVMNKRNIATDDIVNVNKIMDSFVPDLDESLGRLRDS